MDKNPFGWAGMGLGALMQMLRSELTALIFLKVFGGHTCPFLGQLVPLFWISGDVSSGVQSQSGFCLICFLQRQT